MPSRGQSITVNYVAWNTSTNAGQTGDVANHTLRWIKDGTSAAPTNAASEVDSTNAPGVYKLTLTGTECTADYGTLAGKSSTASVSIMPISVAFEQLPTAAAGATGGLADIILDRDMSLGTDSGSSTVRTVRQALRQLRNKWLVSGTTLTVYKEDDATASWTSVVTPTPGATPITGSDPAGP